MHKVIIIMFTNGIISYNPLTFVVSVPMGGHGKSFDLELGFVVCLATGL